jgi:two-component system, chemotaxis family, chemotaxis protein CheY
MARIVIADDSIVMEAILQYLVERLGHTVVGIAKEGAQVVALYKGLHPDVIAMDILLKGSEGLAALKEIKQEDSPTKIVMLVAEGQEVEEEEACQAGADGFLRKPFRLHTVEAELTRILEKKAEEQEQAAKPRTAKV